VINYEPAGSREQSQQINYSHFSENAEVDSAEQRPPVPRYGHGNSDFSPGERRPDCQCKTGVTKSLRNNANLKLIAFIRVFRVDSRLLILICVHQRKICGDFFWLNTAC
jgi:hypothetical protein